MGANKGLFLNNKWHDHKSLMGYDHISTIWSGFEAATIRFYQEWHNGSQSFMQSTSGSTGTARPISIKRDKMEISARATIAALGLKANQNALLCLSPQYIAGKMMMVRSFIGGLNVIGVEPDADPFKSLPEATKIDFTAIVPQQLRKLVDHQNQYINKFSPNANILVGGAKIPYLLEQEAASLPYRIFHTFGMTETVSHIALRNVSDGSHNPNFKVLDEINIDQDHRSCLKIKGAITDHQWLITNDIVELCSKNEFVWKGRFDNIINSGGIKISPENVEQMIEQAFREWNLNHNFFITSLPDPEWGASMILLVESKSDRLDSDSLKAKLKQHLPKYLSPKQIFLLSEFVYTPTNKIDRNKTKRLITAS